MNISSYREDSRFAACPSAFLVTGTKINDALNRKFLKINQTGHWSIRKDRIKRGDLLFFILPQRTSNISTRELYAGVVEVCTPSSEEGRTIISVEKFFRLADVTGSIRTFLQEKLPPQGNRAASIWMATGTAPNFSRELEQASIAAETSSVQARRRRLGNATRMPKRVLTTSLYFQRNPDVVAEVLYLAQGVCAHCKDLAPFVRRKCGTPYLEVHHIQQLSEGGEDAVENAEALCPNCHRYRHYGAAN